MRLKQTSSLVQFLHSLHTFFLALLLPAALVTVSYTFTFLYCSSQPSTFSQHGFCSGFETGR